MEVYICGTNIRLNNYSLIGHISKIEIQFNNILYQISYYLEGKRIEIWVHEDEFEVTDNSIKQEIGFK